MGQEARCVCGGGTAQNKEIAHSTPFSPVPRCSCSEQQCLFHKRKGTVSHLYAPRRDDVTPNAKNICICKWGAGLTSLKPSPLICVNAFLHLAASAAAAFVHTESPFTTASLRDPAEAAIVKISVLGLICIPNGRRNKTKKALRNEKPAATALSFHASLKTD